VKDQLFYDGACPICNTEVKQLKKLAGDSLGFVDINDQIDSPLDLKALSSQLHVLKSNGQWVTGVEANVLVWQHTRYAGLARLLLLPGIKQMSELGYRIWLIYYRWHRNRRLRKTKDSLRGGGV
jgi:predicted DCC family thiol-disulfide oxidoreductase YuxK